MNGRYIMGICIAFVLLGAFVGVASANTIYVPDNHEKIQWAIDNASDGDTIIVRNGTYTENVNVTKKLTLKGLGYPVVDARGSGSAITLSASGVTVEGFTVTNSSYAGIKVISDNNIITNNNVSNNYYGIYPDSSNNNTITSNNISSNNDYGIYLEYSSNNTITSNNIYSNNWPGIYLWYSSSNTITSNVTIQPA